MFPIYGIARKSDKIILIPNSGKRSRTSKTSPRPSIAKQHVWSTVRQGAVAFVLSSADPLILSTLRNKGLPATSSWQPQHLPADVYDKELLRRDFSKVSRPPDFCAEMQRAHQIASYSGCIAPKETSMDITDKTVPFEPRTLVRSGKISDKFSPSCEDSLHRREKQEDEALKKEIEKKKEAWEAEQWAHPPAKLPGTYDPVIGSGAPQNWAPRALSVDDLVSRKVEQKTLWQKAVDLPAPEPYCKRKVTFAPKSTEDTKLCQ
ncbi:hypothetical protein SprV_0200927400 [Sparganum proliferum]